jgi:predicted pyridoxine 5'-phosphate oxidase superfamily flavin-nucleotide-binding protein
MGILTEDMRRVVQEQRLGFIATVCPDGTPNLSPKGTLTVWEDDSLVFADINSPRTVSNLRHNPAIEINVVDAFARKGYRFKGTGAVLTEGPLFEEILAAYRRRGTTSTIRQIVLVRVERAVALVSPAYATGVAEVEVRRRWAAYYSGLHTAEDGGAPQDI